MKPLFAFRLIVILINIIISSYLNRSIAQSCTTATQATNPGSYDGTATNWQSITSGTYNISGTNNTFDGISIFAGGELVIPNGASLQIKVLNIYGGSLYVAGGGTIAIGQLNIGANGATNAKVTNYGTLTLGSALSTSSGDQYYNSGIFSAAGLSFNASGASFTNAGTLQFAGNNVTINGSGFVNNGAVITIGDFTMNNGGICLGPGSVIECNNFTDYANTPGIVNSNPGGGNAGIVISGNANITNNAQPANTTGGLDVALGGCNGSNSSNANYSSAGWGSSVIINCGGTSVPEQNNQKVFYLKSSGALDVLSSWNSKADGTGATPTDFTTQGQVFVITNQTTPTISGSSWTLGGNCILSVGDNKGTNVIFNVPGSKTLDLTGTMIIAPHSYFGIASGGTATFEQGSTLWITSTPVGNGSTGQILGSITGLDQNNVVMDKWIPARSNRNWTFLASPIDAGNISNNWQQQIHITGPATNGIPCATASSSDSDKVNTNNGLDPNQTGNYSMYYFDATVAPGNGQWKPVTSTIDATPAFQLQRANGFRVLIRGPRSEGCALVGTSSTGASNARDTVTLHSFGSIVNLSPGITYTVGNSNPYVMVGNPFACVMDFSQFYNDNNSTNNPSNPITNNYWLYSPENASGNYSTYASGVLSNPSSNYASYSNPSDHSQDSYLGQWQAFIVQLSAPPTAASATVNFKFSQTQKVIQSTTTPFQGTYGAGSNTVIKNLLYVDLKNVTDNSRLDQVAVRFVNDSKVTKTGLSEYDAVSLNSGAQILQTLKANNKMAIQARPALYTNDTVTLDVMSSTDGDFKFDASGLESFSNTDIYLLDKLNGTKQLLNSNPEYVFSVNVNDTTTYKANRFQIIFSQTATAIVTVDTGSATIYKAYPIPFSNQLTVVLPGINQKYAVRLLSETGTAVYNNNFSSGTNTISIKGLANGTYFLEVIDARGNKRAQKIAKLN